jgi:flagellar biosynthesis GTPase FlhF
MKIKSYFADTVETALALARQELGAAHPIGGANPIGRDSGLDRLADDIASMRKQIERMTAAKGYAVSGQGRGGPNVPEDLDEADSDSLVRLVLGLEGTVLEISRAG